MAERFGFSLVAAMLALAACNGQDGAANNAAGAAPAGRSSTAPGKAAVPAAPPTYVLAAGGLEPGLAFGVPRAAALAAATAAFGASTGGDHNDECGEGPMDFVRFHGLSLGFQEGRLVGWMQSDARPALRTAGGLAVGAPRSALGSAGVDESSGVGPEFEVDGVGGILDDGGTRIVALWAGLTCQFR